MKIYSAKMVVQSSQNHKIAEVAAMWLQHQLEVHVVNRPKLLVLLDVHPPNGPLTQPLSNIGSLGMKLEHRIQLHFGMILKCDQVVLQKPWNTRHRGVAFFTSHSPTSLPSGPRGTALLPGQILMMAWMSGANCCMWKGQQPNRKT